MISWESIEFLLRITLGLQLVFWGLNGFFQWIQFKNQPTVINNFVGACIDTRFIMPLVKILEVATGSLLVFNILPRLCLLLLAPLITVILGLHLWHNFKKSYEVIVPLGVPFLFLCYYHFIFRGLAWINN